MMRRVLSLGLLGLGAGAAAFAQVPTETPNVVERAWFQYLDADRAKTSYAVIERIGDCSGTMIGPNIMLTAGHCNPNTISVFFVYPTLNGPQTERFTNTQLLHTFRDTDLVLHYVAPNAAGENPGDKYGYLDLDIVLDDDGRLDYGASRARAAVGTAVYSFWWNRLGTFAGPSQIFFSQGQIKSNSNANPPGGVAVWFAPNLDDGSANFRCGGGRPSLALGVTDNSLGVGGASGSSTVSAANHRLLLGPLSIASSTLGPGRGQLAIVDYLRFGFADPGLLAQDCEPSYSPAVEEAALRALGLSNPERFFGDLEKNRNGAFDLQEAIEAMRGEAPRDFYWLGFESHRRNLLWSPLNREHVAFDLKQGQVAVDARDSAWRSLVALQHDRLNLIPGKRYRVNMLAVQTSRPDDSAPFPLSLTLQDRTGPNQSRVLDPIRDGLWLTAAFDVRNVPYDRLTLSIGRGARLRLMQMSIIADDAVMDFDTFDKRVSWSDAVGGTALVWPNGTGAASGADWAGVLLHNLGGSATQWSLVHHGLGLAAGERARICFQHRISARPAWRPGAGLRGVVSVGEGFGELRGARLSFVPTPSWQGTCTAWFQPRRQSARVRFGTESDDPRAIGAVLIDDVRIERREG